MDLENLSILLHYAFILSCAILALYLTIKIFTQKRVSLSFCLFFLFVSAFSFFGESELNSVTNNHDQNVVTKKKAPTLVSTEQTELGTGVNVKIKCNDNYEYVIIRLKVYKDDTFVNKYEKQLDDLINNKTYTVLFSFSISDMTVINKYSCEIAEYK